MIITVSCRGHGYNKQGGIINMKCLISAIFVSNTHTDARTRANISNWVEGEPFKARHTAIHTSTLVWFCLYVKLELGQDRKAISCLTCWLNTESSNAVQEHFSHPRHTSSALRSDKHHQKHTGRSDGNSSGETRGKGWRVWQKREEHEFSGSLPNQHQKLINRSFQTDDGLTVICVTELSAAYEAEEQLAGWTVFC